nr:hypothetical protein [Bacillaceae bacterium]
MRLKGPGRAPSGEGSKKEKPVPARAAAPDGHVRGKGSFRSCGRASEKKRGPGAQRGRPAGRKGRVKGGEGGREPVAFIGKIP